jgi:telomere resolvase
MGMKWLEQRWDALIAALEPLGQEQEEQIRELCEAEKEWWRQRPGVKVESSLKKPLTETRNHIREVLLLREDNWWVNPKLGAKEHLALKYMNFSTEEWTQMNLPAQEQLQERLEQPLLLADPEAIVARGEQLLQMETWPEQVLGIGLNTGRTLAEILKTGVFRSKTAYSVRIACPFTVYEQMSEFFEVPTLSRAQLVLDAYAKVRQLFGMQFAFVSRRDVGRQCGQEVMKVAYQYFGDLVPLRQGEKDLFKALSRGVYSCLAAYHYCPSWVEELHYMMTIKNHRQGMEATSEVERLTFALAASCLDYALLGDFEREDSPKGIRLGKPDVEVLEVFRVGASGAEEQVC